MKQVAVLSDSVEMRREDSDALIVFTIKQEFKCWQIELEMPDGTRERHVYAKVSAGPHGIYMNPSGAAFEKRRQIVLDKVNQLAEQGFNVGQKYVALFMSRKIPQLILKRHGGQCSRDA